MIPWDLESTHGSLTTSGAYKRNTGHSLEAYLLALLAKARSIAPGKRSENQGDQLLYSEEARTALLDTVQDSLKPIIGLDAVQNASGPTLFHPDFHTRNIFVDSEDPTKITGIIDWQSAAIEPSFMLTAETPDFAEELPHDGSAHEESSTETDELTPQAKVRVDAEFCAKSWAVMLHICPKSRAAHDLDSSLVHLLAAGSAGWLKDAVSMRQILLEVGAKWEELQLPGESFYKPGDTEAAELKRQFDVMKTDRQLRDHLARLVGCQTDGWVPVERWDEVLPVYRKEYRRFVESFLNEAHTDEEKAAAVREANSLWPFDQR